MLHDSSEGNRSFHYGFLSQQPLASATLGIETVKLALLFHYLKQKGISFNACTSVRRELKTMLGSRNNSCCNFSTGKMCTFGGS